MEAPAVAIPNIYTAHRHWCIHCREGWCCEERPCRWRPTMACAAHSVQETEHRRKTDRPSRR